ncbi:MAG: resA [Paenibacillaceae bacterium]|jgi:peroxiredoxin|nr:resA [Paenibacillaceae bacterium]
MGKHRTWIQIAILLVLVIVGAFAVGGSFASRSPLPVVGDKAPDFTLTDLDGQTHQLSEYRGKPVVINFWGTFCPPCRDEMPAIQAQYDKWRQQGFTVLAVNLGENKVTVDSFVKQLKLTFPVLLDPDMDLSRKYGVKLYPTTYFVDKSGKIEAKQEGQMEQDFIERNIMKLLE